MPLSTDDDAYEDDSVASGVPQSFQFGPGRDTTQARISSGQGQRSVASPLFVRFVLWLHAHDHLAARVDDEQVAPRTVHDEMADLLTASGQTSPRRVGERICTGEFVSRGGWRVKPFVRTIWSNAASLYMCVLWHEYVQAERGLTMGSR